MRRVLALIPLVAVLGCNEGVPGDVGFGSGAEGGSSPSGGTGEGPGSGAESQGPGSGAGESGGSGGTGSSDSDPDSATAGGEAGDTSDGSAAGTDGGDETTGDTGGATTGAGETGDESGDMPVELDPCGFPLDGPWIQIEYNNAGGSPSSPSWSYSNTPGWGEAEWAASNANWPEVWDLYQNINVSNDPIGVVAIVGSSAQLQLMLGFEELVGYDYATVCVEGRSVSTSASVQFDAYNPLTGIGNSGSMAHDWNMHATGLDLGQAFEVGGGVQAVRLDATGGSASLGVKRMRLVMHGAVY